ncbi:MAG TPA: saccharopine dehydrogenase C-terminal domain-containing protein [Vicinamibacterales bacterium]|nr:saccharopine dehydrogenase C-terminal domain-containing protein [Vicinamibacterales bacterium]HOQ59829.1 saccharopine dehydrogenase C-terminal domain-containing protein [Vicinamibacterales bacterium]HPK71172.1 saccharopine dehydrogenase C-terminal domain-containing protein [Vicinamibacterales bacterium]
MKILVFGGGGKMGTTVAFDLLKHDAVATVGLADRSHGALENARAWLKSPKVATHQVDVTKRDDLTALMKHYDVGVSTLPDRRTSYIVVDAAVRCGFDFVDILEEYHRRPDAYEVEGLVIPPGMGLNEYGDWLHDTAQKNGVTFLDGIGFAPGMSNVTCGEGIRKLDQAESVIARVGGIPNKEAAARHPLRYMITWAFSHVLREYVIKVCILQDGKIVEVDASSGREAFSFDKFGKSERLECAITPGMPSFVYTRPQLKEFAEKTVRWPGHWDGVQTLKECGMLDLDPVEVGGVKVVPRDVLLARIEPRLRALPGETDVCVMYNTVEGVKDGRRTRISYHLWDEADTVNSVSSMGRVTGYSAAIGAVMVGSGLIAETGIVAPEDAIYGANYAHFIGELAKRNIRILETIETIG